MEQIVPLIKNTALSALSLSVWAASLWLALMATYGATLAIAHRKSRERLKC